MTKDWTKVAALIVTIVIALIAVGRWAGSIEGAVHIVSWQVNEIAKKVATLEERMNGTP